MFCAMIHISPLWRCFIAKGNCEGYAAFSTLPHARTIAGIAPSNNTQRHESRDYRRTLRRGWPTVLAPQVLHFVSREVARFVLSTTDNQ